MDVLRIGRFDARYHLPPSAEGERERLDNVLRAAVDEALERALERAGVAAHEEICIRRLDVPVRLRLSRGDSALAADAFIWRVGFWDRRRAISVRGLARFWLGEKNGRPGPAA